MPEPAHKRQRTPAVYATPLMIPTTALGLSIRLSMFDLRETGDWDIFLGHPERARAETGHQEITLVYICRIRMRLYVIKSLNDIYMSNNF